MGDNMQARLKNDSGSNLSWVIIWLNLTPQRTLNLKINELHAQYDDSDDIPDDTARYLTPNEIVQKCICRANLSTLAQMW